MKRCDQTASERRDGEMIRSDGDNRTAGRLVSYGENSEPAATNQR